MAAYGGAAMWAGTERIGLITPGRTRPSSGLWQRLYLRPLPHQQASFAWGSEAGGVVDMGRVYGPVRRASPPTLAERAS